MNNKLLKKKPAELGINPEAVIDLLKAWENVKGDINSFILMRNGFIAAEGYWKPYKAEYEHMMFSLSKSFTAIAAEFAESEGKLDMDKPAIDYFPVYRDLIHMPSDKILKIKVRHLLSMCSGHKPNADYIFEYKDCVKAFLTSSPEGEPGAFFAYNTAATYMISAIISNIYGLSLTEFLTPRLFEPLGIENIYWDKCAGNIDYGGFGLNIKTEDIAKFGQFLLSGGKYGGKSLIDERYIRDAVKKHINNYTETKYPFLDDFQDEILPFGAMKNDWAQGYSRQFWRCVPNGIYRGDGAFGQLCVVMPEYDAVLAVTAGVEDMQGELTAIWENFIPKAFPENVKYDFKVQQELDKILGSLTIKTPLYTGRDTYFNDMNGRVYQCCSNNLTFDSIGFEYGSDYDTIYIKNIYSEEFKLKAGHNAWIDNDFSHNNHKNKTNPTSISHALAEGFIGSDYKYSHISAACAFEDDTYILKYIQNRTPFSAELRFRIVNYGRINSSGRIDSSERINSDRIECSVSQYPGGRKNVFICFIKR